MDGRCECCKTRCGLCGQEFEHEQAMVDTLIRKFDLESDMRSFASNPKCKRKDRRRQCSECSLTFSTLKGLKQHIGKMHDDTRKESECPICQKSFKNKYAVKFHVRQVHEKSTKVSCPLCPKTIYNKYMLQKHIGLKHSFLTS